MALTDPQRRRLSALIDTIETRGKDHFYMGSWFSEGPNTLSGPNEPADIAFEPERLSDWNQWIDACGTTACIGGWAALAFADDLVRVTDVDTDTENNVIDDVAELVGFPTLWFYEENWPRVPLPVPDGTEFADYERQRALALLRRWRDADGEMTVFDALSDASTGG